MCVHEYSYEYYSCSSRFYQSTGMPAGMATMTEFQLAAGYLFAGMEVRGRGAGSHSSSE